MHSTGLMLLNLQAAALNAGFQWIKHYWSNDVSVIDVRSEHSDVSREQHFISNLFRGRRMNERTIDQPKNKRQLYPMKR